MQTLVIDTNKLITRLQQKGFTKDQAEALMAAAQEIDLSGIATKEYVGEKINQQTWQLVFFIPIPQVTPMDASGLANKQDLNDAVRGLEVRLYKFLAGVLIAHALGTATLTVALVQYFK